MSGSGKRTTGVGLGNLDQARKTWRQESYARGTFCAMMARQERSAVEG